jgi:transcriptional antiterminator RfaH
VFLSATHPSQNEVTASDWFLVYTKPRQESGVCTQLDRQGYDAYLPLYKTLRRMPDGMVMQRSPMFPRYVFFRPGHAGHSIAPVRSTLGVSNIVRFGLTPATVGAEVVEGLRAFELQREQADAQLISPLQTGRRVVICAGPLKGLEGLVSGAVGQRVSVLLDLLGRQPSVNIPNHHLEVLAA